MSLEELRHELAGALGSRRAQQIERQIRCSERYRIADNLEDEMLWTAAAAVRNMGNG